MTDQLKKKFGQTLCVDQLAVFHRLISTDPSLYLYLFSWEPPTSSSHTSTSTSLRYCHHFTMCYVSDHNVSTQYSLQFFFVPPSFMDILAFPRYFTHYPWPPQIPCHYDQTICKTILLLIWYLVLLRVVVSRIIILPLLNRFFKNGLIALFIFLLLPTSFIEC